VSLTVRQIREANGVFVIINEGVNSQVERTAHGAACEMFDRADELRAQAAALLRRADRCEAAACLINATA
jgi:hypothetical protein